MHQRIASLHSESQVPFPAMSKWLQVFNCLHWFIFDECSRRCQKCQPRAHANWTREKKSPVERETTPFRKYMPGWKSNFVDSVIHACFSRSFPRAHGRDVNWGSMVGKEGIFIAFQSSEILTRQLRIIKTLVFKHVDFSIWKTNPME